MRGLLGLGAVVCAAITAAGCGDPPICQSDVFVAITTSQIATDVDAIAMGVQTDVVVRTSASEGDLVTLEVFDEAGVLAMTAKSPALAGGMVRFAAVTVTTPRTRLRATVDGVCGRGTDEVAVDVTAGAGCQLVLIPQPEANTHYAPLAVLTTNNDPDPIADGHQTTLFVTTYPGWVVDMFTSDGASVEQHLGERTADANGVAMIPQALVDGTSSFRATCRGDGNGGNASSTVSTVLVDISRPSCAFTDPAPGSTITPAFDANGDLGDGVQLAIAGLVGGGDVEGEPVSVKITPAGGAAVTVTGTDVDDLGVTRANATLAPPKTPATFELSLAARDHAGNTCTATHNFDVVYDGCDIAVISPTGPITEDADGNPGNGSQADVLLQVATACAGRTVSSICGGVAGPSGVVQADGSLSLRTTACASSPCEAQTACSFQVTTASGVPTSASVNVTFDDQGPATSLAIIAPTLACGVQITPASDVDPATDGVQIQARVTSAGATTTTLELTNGQGGQSFDASGDVVVTLGAGINRLVGVGLDALGNRGQSQQCNVTLADLSVSFAPPVADGIMGRADGSVTGSAIAFPLCGTVNITGATVTVAIDGGAPQPATVTGTTWCRNVSLTESPPSHTIVANATAGASFGTGSVVVKVDLTRPPSVPGFVATAVNRQRIRLSWQSPSDAGLPAVSYVLKFSSTTALNEANFDTAGTVLATGTPGAIGSPETLDMFPARTGTAFSFAIAATDAAGNRSIVSAVGPVTPDFDHGGALTSPDAAQGTLALGFSMTHGKFNDDDFDDLAISAPTQGLGTALRAGTVYVYFGGPAGTSSTPDLTISHTAANALFGSGLTAVRWSSATRDDLVIGAPGADTHGHVFVFHGGTLTGGTRSAASADLHITANATTPGFFATSSLGRTLATADVDGDGTDDLVIAAPTGGGTIGGFVILYGDTVNGNIALSDLDASGANGSIAELFRDPNGAPGHQLGFYLHAVGPTEGAGDTTDDLVAAYIDDYNTSVDTLFIVRSDGTRPVAAGVVARNFAIGRDVRVDLSTVSKLAEYGAHVTSIEDQNGDGARDLVIGIHRLFNDTGQVIILDGDTVGVGGVALTTDPGVTLTTILGASKSSLGAFVLSADRVASADIDGDGREDLVLGALVGNVGRGLVWFGGEIPAGNTTLATASLSIPTPSFLFTRQAPKGIAGNAEWVGDLDGDGLDDICWASPSDAPSGDGVFEILLD